MYLFLYYFIYSNIIFGAFYGMLIYLLFTCILYVFFFYFGSFHQDRGRKVSKYWSMMATDQT